MKRILLTLSFIAFNFIIIKAQSFIIDNLEYTVIGTTNTVSVARANNYWPSGTLAIPSTVTNGSTIYTVTNIRETAFSNCDGLTAITIPNSVASIGANAFSDCNFLSSLTIPNSVVNIGNGAFSNVKNIIYNGDASGSPWGALTMNGVIDGDFIYADAEKKRLTAYIGNGGDVTIPFGVISIGDLAFAYCHGLVSVTIPNSVGNIGRCAFFLCSNLASVTISNSVKSIGKQAFEQCHSLTSVVIPNSVTSIGEYAFYYCYGLVSVTIPSSVKSIGKKAFWNCRGLTTITIPNSVTSIGDDAFYNVNNIVYTGSASGKPWGALSVNAIIDGDFIYSDNAKTNLTLYIGNGGNVVIPNSVTSIGAGAFKNCIGLTSLYIPSSVNKIYDNIVKDCDNLQYISMQSTTPPTITESSFSSLDASFPIYIPCGYLSAYTSANYWKDRVLVEDFVYRLELEPNDAAMGSAEIETAPTCGGAAVIKAVSNRYFEFTQWSDGNTDNPRSILITQDTKLTANFQYHLVATVESADENMGEVSESSGVFNNITDIEISATPAYGYHFTQWSDGVTINPRVVRLSTDTLLRAQFAPNPHTITVKTNDATLGTVNGGGVFDYNSQNTITAEATNGYKFGKWSDGNMENPRKILLTSDTTLTAIFVEDRLYDVDVTTQDSAKGMVSGSGKYDYGTEVILQATPAENCYFVQWSDGSSSNPRILLVETDMNLVAKFDTLQIFNIQVQASDTARGTVSGSGKFVSGTEASLSATPRQHYVFSQWSDGRTDNPRTVRVIANATYTAVFVPEQYSVTLSQNNADMGMVSGSGVYSYGDMVSCLAKPYQNYHFVQWSNGETANPYEFVIEGNQLLTAYFAAGAVTGIEDDAAPQPIIYAVGKTIVVENATDEILVYDAMGKLLCRDAIHRVRAEITVNGTGVYIVKTGNAVMRVVVN